MGAIDRLGLDGGIPPGIEQEDVFGGGQVQAEAARLQTHQEQRTVGIGLKALDARFAVARAAVEIFVGHAVAIERETDDVEQADELGEDDRLVSLFAQQAQIGEQHIELRARRVDLRSIDQPGMTRRLPQPQQRLQHVQPRLVPPFLRDALRQRLTIVVPQLVVALTLGAAQAADDRVLDALRQIACDVRFRAAQDERPQHARERIARRAWNAGARATSALPLRRFRCCRCHCRCCRCCSSRARTLAISRAFQD